MDMKTSFLNGDFTEEIYTKRPEGLDVPIDKVCKLTKYIYDLKQVSKLWHEKFDRIICGNGYRVNESDKCLYIKIAEENVVVICLYVDGMLIIRTDLEIVLYQENSIGPSKEILLAQFSMKDLGTTYLILRIKILYIKDGIRLSQSHYIKSMVKKYGYLDLPELSCHMITIRSFDPTM